MCPLQMPMLLHNKSSVTKKKKIMKSHFIIFVSVHFFPINPVSQVTPNHYLIAANLSKLIHFQTKTVVTIQIIHKYTLYINPLTLICTNLELPLKHRLTSVDDFEERNIKKNWEGQMHDKVRQLLTNASYALCQPRERLSLC